MLRPLSLLSVLLIVLCTACGSSKPLSDEAASAVSANRMVVSKMPVAVQSQSAYELISQYNPQWLRKRGRSSINNPVPIKVYLDGVTSAYGTVRSLRRISARDIAVIEHFTASEAQFKFGLGNTSGAILVHTRSGR
mgnify:FL=1